MYFFLGVLIATLVALLVLPAVWHRAVRLTTKRVEAAVPVSIFEIQADKDQQRAFFALNQRRIELQTEALRDTIVAHAATIETQRQKAFDLEQALADLTARHGTLTGTSAERDVLLGETQDQLADRVARVADLETQVAAQLDAIAGQKTEIERLSEEEAALNATLKTSEATLAAQTAEIDGLKAELARLNGTLAETISRRDELAALLDAETATLAEARTSAATAATAAAAEIAGLGSSLTSRTQESEARAGTVAALEAERTRLEEALRVATTDLESSRAVVHAFEQRRAREFADAEAETKRLSDTLHMLRANHALMEDALREARAQPAGASADVPADAVALKDALADVAAQVTALAARMEGDASPIRALVAGAEAGTTPDLAARIRDLLDRQDDGPGAAAAE